MTRTTIFLALIILCAFVRPVLSSEQIGGYSHEEAMAAGEKMYRYGILPDGKPMKAYVMGDIPVDGRMFTCDDCHQRSGIGSEEGTVITWPVNGKELFIPRRRTGAFKPPENKADRQNVRRQLPEYYRVPHARPAYTDESLAKAIRSGVDPTGRKIDPVMPTYRLGRKNITLLTYYLQNLSAENSPGVTETTLHFATVIGSDVDDGEKEAMLAVLQSHIDARNAQTRHEGKRATAGPFYKTERYMSYRKLALHVWQLQGEKESWGRQLEEYYRQQPVFGLLGGIVSNSWQPVHDFCEKNRIPSILPVTDLPVISDTDWYTLYFSKGLYQEGESTARYLLSEEKDESRIIQVYNQDDAHGRALASGFSDTWEKDGRQVESLILGTGVPVLRNSTPLDEDKPAIVLLWLNNDHISENQNALDTLPKGEITIVSGSLLKYTFTALPEKLRTTLLATHPANLGDANPERRAMVERWLKIRKIDTNHFDIKAKMYFLGWMLPGGLKGMRSEFIREYFMEQFDMMVDQDYSIAVYPRLTFGSGQRYASKGCYLVTVGQDGKSLTPVTDWVIH